MYCYGSLYIQDNTVKNSMSIVATTAPTTIAKTIAKTTTERQQQQQQQQQQRRRSLLPSHEYEGLVKTFFPSPFHCLRSPTDEGKIESNR